MEKSMLDMLWIIVASSLVFFMQAGFAFVESGLTRTKNSINVAMKNLTDLGVSTLIFWAVGFGLMFGGNSFGWFGSTHFLTGLETPYLAVFFLFQAMFCSTSATIVSGAVAERMRFSSYIISTIILSSIIYPITGHWAWGGGLEGSPAGWLGKMGFVDFAGSTVVHSVGGWMSLAALLIIGPRNGRFVDGEKPRKINGSDIPAAIVGVMILWFGWFGFNGGSTLAMNGAVAPIIMKTSLAAASGMMVTLLAGWILTRTPDVGFVVNGSLAGLVAITASCHSVTALDAVIIGGIGGLVMMSLSALLLKLKIDDAVDAVPVHLGAGIWGTLAVGLFGKTEILGTGLSRGQQILAQVIGIVSVGLWAFLVSLIVLFIINKIKPLRVTLDEEHAGLNIAEHGASTEIYELYRTMDVQAQTGRLDLRLPVEPFTEIGQIARRYNQVLESLEGQVVAKSDYLSILDNVSDGLFLLEKDFNFGPYYSRAMKRIFRRENFDNENFKNMLGYLLPQDTMQQISDYLDLLFMDRMSVTTLERLNPLEEIELFIDEGNGQFVSRFVRFHFKRIEENQHVVRLMGIARDVTEQVKLSREMDLLKQDSQTEMEMFYRILHLEPRLFVEFLGGAEEEIRRINGILEENSSAEALPEKLNAIYRHIHTLKGDARLLELDFFAEKAHAFEEKLKALKTQKTLANRDFIPLAVSLSDMYDLLTQMQSLVERVRHFQNAFVELNTTGDELIVLSLKTLIEQTAGKNGKKAALEAGNFRSELIPKSIKKNIKDTLVQFARNSIVHGIEIPEERKLKGKTEEGRISISTEIREGSLDIIYRDDGRGLDYEKLRQKAAESGKVSAEQAKKLSRHELVSLIFETGFSTAETENLDAGRGVGMGIVRKMMDKLCAKLTVRNHPGQFCEFALSIPIETA